MNFDKNLLLQYEECMPKINYLVFRKCPSTWHLNENVVNNCGITYLIKGSAQYTVNGTQYDVSEGENDLICMSSDDVKEAVTDFQILMGCFRINFAMKNSKGEEVSPPAGKPYRKKYRPHTSFL
jgi:hypothetical protein